jgi:hypothetical protein
MGRGLTKEDRPWALILVVSFTIIVVGVALRSTWIISLGGLGIIVLVFHYGF